MTSPQANTKDAGTRKKERRTVIVWFWKQLQAMSVLLIALIVLMLVERLALTLALSSPKVMIDNVFVPEDMSRLISAFLFMLGTNMLWIFTQWGSSMLATHTEQKAVGHLQGQILEDIYRQPLSQVRREKIGHEVQLLTSDVQQAGQLFARRVPGMIQEIGGLAMAMVIVAAGSPWLLGFALIFGVVHVWLGVKFGPKRRAMTRQMKDARANLLAQVEEGITTTREVVAFGRQDWDEKRYRGHFELYLDKVMAEGALLNKEVWRSEPWRWLAVLVVLGVGGYQVMVGTMSLGMFVLVFQFTSTIMSAIHQLYFGTMGAVSQLGAVDRLYNRVSEIDQGKPATMALQEPIATWALKDVTYTPIGAEHPLFESCSLEIPIGSHLGIVGPSGSGKSTLARLLIGLAEPDYGKVMLNGESLDRWVEASWRSKVAIVFQEPFLLPASIRENIEWGRTSYSEELLWNACEMAEIATDIRHFEQGLDTQVGERGISLSGGQRQRIALARALLGQPEVLILDEATSALDMETERRVMRRLALLRGEMTLLVIAHREAAIAHMDAVCKLESAERLRIYLASDLK